MALLVAALAQRSGWTHHGSAVDGFVCPFHWLVGAPCPLCGGTRAFFLLAHAEWGAALRFAPGPTLLVLGALIVGAWAALAEVTGRFWPVAVTRHIPLLATLALLLFWPLQFVAGIGGS